MNKKVERVLLVAVSFIFLCLNIPAYFCLNCITYLLNSFSIIIYCPVFLFLVSGILDTDNLKSRYYVIIHFLYILLPVILGLNYFFTRNEGFVFVVSSIVFLVTSLVNIFFFYKKIKSINRDHFKHMKFWNLLFTTGFTVIFALLSLFIEIPETKLFLVCISPLMFLLLAYEKIELEDKN